MKISSATLVTPMAPMSYCKPGLHVYLCICRHIVSSFRLVVHVAARDGINQTQIHLYFKGGANGKYVLAAHTVSQSSKIQGEQLHHSLSKCNTACISTYMYCIVLLVFFGIQVCYLMTLLQCFN